LRSRLLDRVSRLSLEASAAQSRSIISAERQRGRVLARQLLAPPLGAVHYAQLGLEPGTTRARGIPEGVPLTLAFGYSLAEGLALWHGSTTRRARDAGALGAVFNAGISLYDHQLDSGRRALLPPPVAIGVTDGALTPATQTEPGTEPAAVILRRLIDLFFRRLAMMAPTPALSWALADSLRRAQAAEVATSRERSPTPADVSAKAVLPFEILELIALTVVKPDRVLVDRQRLGRPLGAVFAAVDDIADLEQDARLGHANTFLSARQPSAASASRSRLRVRDDAIKGVDEAARELAALAGTLRAKRLTLSSQFAFADVVVAYAWGWLV